MATVFTESFTGTQSSNGKTLTFTDISNWSNNTEGYLKANFVRTFVLLDANGDEIDTIVLPIDSDVATVNITADTWVNSTLTIEGVADYTKTLLFPFDRITKNLYRFLLKAGCCANSVTEKALSAADRFFRGAEISAISGDGPGWQNCIDAAYGYLNQNHS